MILLHIHSDLWGLQAIVYMHQHPQAVTSSVILWTWTLNFELWTLFISLVVKEGTSSGFTCTELRLST
jgi:hypothetical protein